MSKKEKKGRTMCQETKLSEIQIVPVFPDNGLIAFASFVIDNRYFVGNVAIYTKPDGLDYRLLYPAKTLPNGKKITLFHPINRKTGEAIKQAIIEKYRNLIMDTEAEKVFNE